MNEEFQWQRQPEAEKIVERVLQNALARNPAIAELSSQVEGFASSRLFDWVDHVEVPSNVDLLESAKKAGFTQEEGNTYRHPGAQLPSIVFSDRLGIFVKVESIADFLQVRGLDREIEGGMLSPYRRAKISEEGGASLWVVERRGSRTMIPTYPASDYVANYLEGLERWKTRPRSVLNTREDLLYAIDLARDLIGEVGRDVAAWIVLEAERSFWQAKNFAGQMQKARQDRLGMGWANHDHHTFRSSRAFFPLLVELFEVLGFHCRERFYAGREAGWGAQVMENSIAGLVLFLDVDLSPEEIAIDFAHDPLPREEKLGTIGLWCGLHGDSILASGMHHLEAQFQFDELRGDLGKLGIEMMNPFSDFPYLRQQFTKGEVWPVSEERIKFLLNEKFITPQEAEKFRSQGAVGSHMENLQRREGYKGFNQKNVSDIILRTDPRR